MGLELSDLPARFQSSKVGHKMIMRHILSKIETCGPQEIIESFGGFVDSEKTLDVINQIELYLEGHKVGKRVGRREAKSDQT